MALTRTEKVAGRWFRDNEQAKLTQLYADSPPDITAMSFLSHQRHECPGRRNLSVAIELKEVYLTNPELIVLADGTVRPPEDADNDRTDVQGVVAPGRFGFYYKQGTCKSKGCGQTARSKAGKFVDAYERPPIEGRVARSGG